LKKIVKQEGKKSLVVYMTDKWKVMMLKFFDIDLIEWSKDLPNRRNPSMLENVINLGKPSLHLFGAKLELYN